MLLRMNHAATLVHQHLAPTALQSRGAAFSTISIRSIISPSSGGGAT